MVSLVAPENLGWGGGGVCCGYGLQPPHDTLHFPSYRYHVNCAGLLHSYHEDFNRGCYTITGLRAWNFRQSQLGLDKTGGNSMMNSPSWNVGTYLIKRLEGEQKP